MEITGTSVYELQDALYQIENSINYGERARLQIKSEELPTQEELNTFYQNLILDGFHTSKPTARIVNGIPQTELVLTKGSPAWWALLIPIIPTVLIVGLIGFGIAKLEDITKALMPLVLVVGGITIALAAAVAVSPRAARVAEVTIPRRR